MQPKQAPLEHYRTQAPQTGDVITDLPSSCWAEPACFPSRISSWSGQTVKHCQKSQMGKKHGYHDDKIPFSPHVQVLRTIAKHQRLFVHAAPLQRGEVRLLQGGLLSNLSLSVIRAWGRAVHSAVTWSVCCRCFLHISAKRRHSGQLQQGEMNIFFLLRQRYFQFMWCVQGQKFVPKVPQGK